MSPNLFYSQGMLLLAAFASAAVPPVIEWKFRSTPPTPAIKWQFDGDYETMTVPANSEVKFSWSGRHDVKSLSTTDEFENCDVTGAETELFADIGGSGTVTVPEGQNFYVCSLGGGFHCNKGMKIQINGEKIPTNGEKIPTMTVPANSEVEFSWSGNHNVVSLSTVDEFENCDTTGAKLELAASGTVTVPEGTNFYVCSLGSGFHCNKGMKIQINGEVASTSQPTPGPTAAPTETPTDSPTPTPTTLPTVDPTTTPTETPTDSPTPTPTTLPTVDPTTTPTETPTDSPTETPTETPTAPQTSDPTATPTETPTPDTVDPTEAPTKAPIQESCAVISNKRKCKKALDGNTCEFKKKKCGFIKKADCVSANDAGNRKKVKKACKKLKKTCTMNEKVCVDIPIEPTVDCDSLDKICNSNCATVPKKNKKACRKACRKAKKKCSIEAG